MPTYRSVLLNALNTFATNSYSDGYDWNELIEGDWVFDDLTDAQLYVLLLDYLNYMKREE
jgi:hypothetical protein